MLMQVVFLRDEGFVVASKVRTYWYSFPQPMRRTVTSNNACRTEELDDTLKPILRGEAADACRIKQILSLETVSQSSGSPASFLCYRDESDKIQTRKRCHRTKTEPPTEPC
jgi:hypothetical protein